MLPNFKSFQILMNFCSNHFTISNEELWARYGFLVVLDYHKRHYENYIGQVKYDVNIFASGNLLLRPNWLPQVNLNDLNDA